MILFFFTFFFRIFLFLALLSVFESENDDNGNNHFLIVFSFDGFKYDYLNAENTPFLWSQLKSGVTGYMLPTFSTKTLPNHHSIATGCYQETHGVVHNHMYDPTDHTEYHASVKNDTSFWFSDNPKVIPIYIANQLANPYAASVLSPWIAGQVYYGRLKHRARYMRPFKHSASPYDLFSWSLQLLKKPHPPLYQRVNLCMIYLPEPDSTGHLQGPTSPKTIVKTKELDEFLKHVYEQLKLNNLLSRANIIVLSDHGLSSIEPERSVILTDILPDTSLYRADGGNPLYHIRPVPGKHEEILNTLRQHSAANHYDVYDRKDIPERWHYRNHRRIGDIIVVAHNEWSLFRDKADAELNDHARGEHGYDNAFPDMRPLFFASGPSFKVNYTHSQRFENVDLYPLMLHLLGIPAYGRFFHEGQFDRIKGILRDKAK